MTEKKKEALQEEKEQEQSQKRESALEVSSMPKKAKYLPGEEIDFEGLALSLSGEDVTENAEFSVEEGEAWAAKDRKLPVTAKVVRDSEIYEAEFVLKRKTRILPFIIAAVIAALLACAGAYLWWDAQPKGDTGSYIIPQGDMTDEEAQEMLDDMAERSRIIVSIRPTEELKDNGALHVNFVVVEDNNGFAERLEVEQDGQVVYKSGIVQPDHMIEWGQATGAHAGPATATVYAVDPDGNDSGNPVSVEVEIVEVQ